MTLIRDRPKKPGMIHTDEAYLRIVLDAIIVCARYKPKFGQGTRGGGLTFEGFRELYQQDTFYSWFGLDNPLTELSNAAFNHQSMSLKDDRQLPIPLDFDVSEVFWKDTCFVLQGAAENPPGAASVVFGDARQLPDAVDGPFDLVITSPPYANRMSYIRELRPYMYWLGFLDSGRAAGELDWSAIGGTWGVATSRLTDCERSAESLIHSLLEAALDGIANHSNKNGQILSNYVARYFEDLWEHFKSLITVLADGSDLHYVVGNSTFYGVLLPVGRIYAAMLKRLGFQDVRCRTIRKGNSKKELFEFDVSARWGGPKCPMWQRTARP